MCWSTADYFNDQQDRSAGGIAVVTNDGTPRSLELVRNGKITAEVWHGFPEWGWHGVEYAVRTVLGYEVSRNHDILPRVEHRQNISQFIPIPCLKAIEWPGRE